MYFNFDEEDELKSIFETNKNPNRIIELLSMIAGEKILPEKTLLIFDEIQEYPEALNSLKYFKEKANEYHVIAAGSLLGTLLAQPKSYLVGMVNLLDLYPLTFDEFLAATDEGLYQYYSEIKKEQPIEEIFHNRLLEAYHCYLIIGGMPECASSWVRYKDPAKVAQIQRELILRLIAFGLYTIQLSFFIGLRQNTCCQTLCSIGVFVAVENLGSFCFHILSSNFTRIALGQDTCSKGLLNFRASI